VLAAGTQLVGGFRHQNVHLTTVVKSVYGIPGYRRTRPRESALSHCKIVVYPQRGKPEIPTSPRLLQIRLFLLGDLIATEAFSCRRRAQTASDQWETGVFGCADVSFASLRPAWRFPGRKGPKLGPDDSDTKNRRLTRATRSRMRIIRIYGKSFTQTLP
jgi:hypothetical protein